MPRRVEGKVALITGAARGQGRAHAIRLAEEGASIIAVDAVQPSIETIPYELSSEADLAETARLVEELDARILTTVADVRDQSALDAAVDAGLAEFGQIDIVCANAGVLSLDKSWEMSEEKWQVTIDINLTGVWRTIKAVTPAMLEADNGGSIIITSSTAYHKGTPNIANYVASKHGVVGLMRSLANELSPSYIRVNSVAPSNVATPLILNDSLFRTFCPDIEEPTAEDAAKVIGAVHLIPEPWVEPREISNAVLWLASDESRYVTGAVIPVDLGMLTKVL